MDEATKAGYGVLLMRQALPKSEFYAKTTARLRSTLEPPSAGPADTLPFGVLGRGPARKPLDLAKGAHVAALAARLDELHGATAHAAARGAPRNDGLDEATLALYARLAQLLDADPVGRLEALRTDQRATCAEVRATKMDVRAQIAQILAKKNAINARLSRVESTLARTVQEAVRQPLAGVSTKMDAIATDLKPVPGAVSRMESELHALKSDTRLADRVDGLASDVADANRKEVARDDAQTALRAEVAALTEKVEALRAASSGTDVLQAISNLRSELRPPAPPLPEPTRTDSPPTSAGRSRESAFKASNASSQQTAVQRHDGTSLPTSAASSHVGASADLGAHALGASVSVSSAHASQDLVRMSSVEETVNAPLADAISRAASERARDARPLQDTPPKDDDSTGPPAWMCDSSVDGGGSLMSETLRARSDSSTTPPIPEEEDLGGIDP